jgi:hypothetical protein
MMTTDNSRQRLIDAALEQIKSDVQREDMTAIEELIRELPTDTLINFLPEN